MTFPIVSAILLLSLIAQSQAESPLPPSIPKNATHTHWVDEPNCGRGTEAIIWQCLTTIALCVYVALHLSVPSTPLSWKASLFQRSFWIIIGLLSPEVVCVMAIEQFFEAKNLAKRAKALGFPISLQQAFLLYSGGLGIQPPDVADDDQITPEDATNDNASTSHTISHTRSPSRQLSARLLSSDSSFWIYGFRNKDTEIVKLWVGHYTDEAITLCAARAPSDEEINARSKADLLAKTIVSIQTLYALVQIISRAIEGYDIALLEFTTTAYIIIAAFTYGFWFRKPYNMGSPIIKYVDKDSTKEVTFEIETFWNTADTLSWKSTFSFGGKLEWVFNSENVETATYSSSWGFPVLSVLFGAVHCLAWNYNFATSLEAWMWRVTTIVIIVIPVVWTILTLQEKPSSHTMRRIMETIWFMMTILYILSRFYLIIECFVAFRDAPVGIYRKVSWTSHIWHLGT